MIQLTEIVDPNNQWFRKGKLWKWSGVPKLSIPTIYSWDRKFGQEISNRKGLGIKTLTMYLRFTKTHVIAYYFHNLNCVFELRFNYHNCYTNRCVCVTQITWLYNMYPSARCPSHLAMCTEICRIPIFIANVGYHPGCKTADHVLSMWSIHLKGKRKY